MNTKKSFRALVRGTKKQTNKGGREILRKPVVWQSGVLISVLKIIPMSSLLFRFDFLD